VTLGGRFGGLPTSGNELKISGVLNLRITQDGIVLPGRDRPLSPFLPFLERVAELDDKARVKLNSSGLAALSRRMLAAALSRKEHGMARSSV
jgi:hypothetical protein